MNGLEYAQKFIDRYLPNQDQKIAEIQAIIEKLIQNGITSVEAVFQAVLETLNKADQKIRQKVVKNQAKR